MGSGPFTGQAPHSPDPESLTSFQLSETGLGSQTKQPCSALLKEAGLRPVPGWTALVACSSQLFHVPVSAGAAH